MKNIKVFSVALIATFVLFRVFLFIFPFSNANVGSYNIHHLFPGVFMLTIIIPFLLAGINNAKIALTAGFGSALVLDEIVYLIATDGSDLSYLSPVSFWGGVFFMCIIVAVTLLVYHIKKNNLQKSL